MARLDVSVSMYGSDEVCGVGVRSHGATSDLV